MTGAERRGRSRGELIRQGAQAHFVGRRAQISLFVENLAKDPLAETDPAAFLFHVRGVGGVGKSTLLRQWQESARRADAVTAVVDENDVHDVHQAMTEMARQLAQQTGRLKDFDRAAERYRREQEAAAEPTAASGAAEGEVSASSRVGAEVLLGAASLFPVVSTVAAMASPDTVAQGVHRLQAGLRAHDRRGRGGDPTGLSRAFVEEVSRLCDRHRWVVLFFDTWEETARYLDEWLRDLLQDAYGPLPANVVVVLAGRDELGEREWSSLRAWVADVPLDVFTEAETRTLLAARGVTETAVVEAVLRLSMGLPLLVELLALARPDSADDVDAGGDVVDSAVKRFVQWIPDLRHRETVLACAIAPYLNADVFTAAVPQEAEGLWEWLCRQPFVSGHGDFKQYHAVVRSSMVRQQRAQSPQRWTAAHLRLAEAHAAWRAEVERGLLKAKRWDDPGWRRHRLDETYHRLCAHPAAELPAAAELTVHAAGHDTAILRQWADALATAARDTDDAALIAWTSRLQNAVAGEEPGLTVLGTLLRHAGLSADARAWAHGYRGRILYLDDRTEEALAELDLAVVADPRNARAWAYRSEAHRLLGHIDSALSDVATALTLSPDDAWALGARGGILVQAGRIEEAVVDLTAALDIDPQDAFTLSQRGEAHRLAGRPDQAISDFTAALAIEPTTDWALAVRGEANSQAGRYADAIADLTAALGLYAKIAFALG
jgi:tetratricopeptide (TPR) repeat protein